MATLWTIGYEGQTPDSLVALLGHAKVQRVVDVRQLPLSRKKGFSKKGLADLLAQHGIAYTHKPELGVDKAVRDAFRATGDIVELEQWYSSHLRAQGASLAGLLQLIDQERVCLLCFEADHEACHRGLLARRLAQAGVEARHI